MARQQESNRTERAAHLPVHGAPPVPLDGNKRTGRLLMNDPRRPRRLTLWDCIST